MNKLPPTLVQQPQLDLWLNFSSDGVLRLRTGKVELGQGIKTALAMICAEELDLNVQQISVEPVDTALSPNEMITAGSMSIEMGGAAIRQVSAEARQFLLKLAAERLDVSAAELRVTEGMVSHPDSNEHVSYWQLMQDRTFGIEADGGAQPKSSDQLRIVGRSVPRVDLYGKFTGARAFIQDTLLEKVLHARVVRPPAIGARLVSRQEDLAAQLDESIRLHIDGSFIGVLAATETAVIDAYDLVKSKARWDLSLVAQPPTDLAEFLLTSPAVSLPVISGMPVEEAVPDIVRGDAAVVTVESSYLKPFHMHGSLAPSAAIAHWDNGKLEVWTHSQGPFILRESLARVLGLDSLDIRVMHRENSGCYGHNGADDAAFEAALLARSHAGMTVLLKWTRDDEHSSEPYSPAMLMQLKGDVDINGHIVAWNHEVYSNSHMGRPAPHRSVTNFVSAWHLANPIARPEPRPGMAPHGGIHRNADPYYDFDNRRIIKHLVKTNPVRTSSTRGLGAYGNVFAIESFMDELAQAAGIEPIEFRKAHLTDTRARVVIDAAIEKFNEQPLAARYNGDAVAHQLFGQGLAFARYKNVQTYAAVVVGLSVDSRTFEVSLVHAVIAADAGRIIDRDGLANQLEGGLIQSASWTLKEQVKFAGVEVVSRDWETYPILTFPEIPTVDLVLLDQPQERSLGAGEATQGPTAAAIANAITDAIGLRPREIPFTADNLRQLALES